MNYINVNGFKRVFKSKAKKLYDEGKTIFICPYKVNPDNAWNITNEINKEDDTHIKDFEDRIDYYAYYNCDTTLGKYPAYYIKD